MKYNGVQSRRQGKAFVGLDPLDELLCPVNVFVSEKKTVCIAYTLVSELLHVIAPPPQLRTGSDGLQTTMEFNGGSTYRV